MTKPLSIISTVVLLFFSLSSFAQDDDFINDYLERFENSKTYLLLVAEAMPQHQYNFKVTPESKSFAENLMHIAWAMDWHSKTLLGDRPARDWETDLELKVAQKSKADMIATISKTFDDTTLFLKKFDVNDLNDELDYLGLNRTKRQIFLLLSDHITHHRGQMLVSLRLNKIAPPRYVLYQ